MLWLFLAAVVFCVYTYVGFPLWLHWRAGAVRKVTDSAAFGSRPVQSRDPASWPTVSIVVAAHNEAQRLPAKLESLRALDYPDDRLEIIIVSDGSTDDTNSLLANEPDIVFEHYHPARGKPTALNRGMHVASGEFLVFMDARQRISANAIKAMIGRFDANADLAGEIGVVSGELVLSDDGQTEAANVGLYWRYEKWIRMNESLVGSTTGATGALYAVRAGDAIRLPEDAILDDFEIPINTLKNGKRTVLEPAARAFDQAEQDSANEFRRKVRTLSGNYQSFARHAWLFDPTRNPCWWQFLSHKVFRLLVPLAMLIALLSSLVGQGWFLKTALLVQFAFYAAGLTAMLLPAFANNRLLNFIKVFLQLNAAAVVGAWRYFSGSASVRWRTAS